MHTWADICIALTKFVPCAILLFRKNIKILKVLPERRSMTLDLLVKGVVCVCLFGLCV